ncbi:MAG: leucine-rich repeat protein [Eubacterium sp.]|nr:leucine-rich repeat protein [Eubacterium sp.]
MKKVISIILTVLLLLSIFCAAPMTAFAYISTYGEIRAPGGNVYYELDYSTETLYIRGVGNMEDFLYTFEEPYYGTGNDYNGEYLYATRPSPFSWGDNDCIKNVIIDEGVTSIGRAAFLNCRNITSVTIPSTLIKICEGAFSNCSGLTNVKLPDNLNTIGGWAFSNCSALSSINIPDEVSEIPYRAFINCESLKSITLSNNVTRIGDEAFSGCTNLVNIDMPEQLTELGTYVFSNCTSLKELAIPEGITSFNGDLIDNCISLENLYLPATLESITGDFRSCSSISGVYINDIKQWCSCKFTSYTSSIDNFQTIHSSNPLSYAHHLYINNQLVKDLVVPGECESVSSCAFIGCTDFESVTFNEGVERIDSGAFKNCTNLQKLYIPKSMKEIWDEFVNCSALNGIYIKDLEQWCKCYFPIYYSSQDNFQTPHLRNPLLSAHHLYLNNKLVKEIELSVEKITDSAFAGCTDLESVTINSYNIGGYAFYDCTNLKTVSISETPSKVWVYENAFNNCVKLKNVMLPNYVEVCESAFKNCYSISDVFYNGSENGWENGCYWKDGNDVQRVTINEYNECLINANIHFKFDEDHCVNGSQHNFEVEVSDSEVSEVYEICNLCGYKRHCDHIHYYIFKDGKPICQGGTGEITYTCKWCDETFKEYGVEHLVGYGEKITEPTCKEYGLSILFDYCTECGEIIHEYEAFELETLADHTPAAAVKENEVASTCTTNGTYDEVVYCSVCGEEVERTQRSLDLDPKVHTPSALTYENIVAASCKNEGSYDEVVYCSECGEELSRETQTIPKTDHTPADAIKENEFPATYDKAGSYDEVVYCSVCGEELSRETKAIAKLKKTSLAKATVSGIKDKVYTGKALTQSITVKLGSKTLKKDTDYKVTYTNNKNVGKATVTITGINAYSGTISKTFKINPKATTLSKVTAGSKSFTATWKKQATQTTGYEIQYATDSKFTKNKKSVTVSKNSTVKTTVKKLTAKKKYYVRIRTYKTVSGTKYYSAWSATKTVTTKK